MEPFKELLAKRRPDGTPMIYRDDADVTFVQGQLFKEGLVNGNAVKAALKVLDELPTTSEVYTHVLDEVKLLSNQTDKRFHKPLIEEFLERLGEPFHEPLGNPRAHVQEQEQEQEQEYKEKVNKKESPEPTDPPKSKKKRAQPGAKKPYREFVLLKPTEYNRLVSEFGKPQTETMLNMLDNYIGANPKKRNNYTDHNRVLRGWVLERYEEKNNNLRNGKNGNGGNGNEFSGKKYTGTPIEDIPWAKNPTEDMPGTRPI